MSIGSEARRICGVVLLSLLGTAGHTQPQLVPAISEGTSAGLDHSQVIAKYQDLAAVLGAALKAKVAVVFAREFSTLENG